MTRQEHFEQWIKNIYPMVTLEYNPEGDCYIGAFAFIAYQAWKEAPLRRPCEKSRITKEQLEAMKADDPETLVDRLNGWYSQTPEPYAVPKIQEEAAREIERLRAEIERLKA